MVSCPRPLGLTHTPSQLLAFLPNSSLCLWSLARPLPSAWNSLSSLRHPSQLFLPFCEVRYHHHLL